MNLESIERPATDEARRIADLDRRLTLAVEAVEELAAIVNRMRVSLCNAWTEVGIVAKKKEK